MTNLMSVASPGLPAQEDGGTVLPAQEEGGAALDHHLHQPGQEDVAVNVGTCLHMSLCLHISSYLHTFSYLLEFSN